ncbi:MAG: ABC transporter substrate-binding protein [Acetobacteraceae bacterium SCN 69-10]|nr:MAG: ABC transporter substrate-binding protein [Acetobacteraceae bacterium SCN 69-10]OJY65031.1 MAG: ABC transporter substrate-binding protein [Rhodospirillales bacterium 70-18]
MTLRTSRRATLLGGLSLPFVSRLARAAGEPVRLGTLCPLTGAGGSYGPAMVKVAKTIVDEVNAAGGVLGRQILLTGEDDQTNPDAGVRAARKLIDVDKVDAVIGTWASSVTTAVAPLCWENKVMLFTVSGADSITQMPHKGFIIRTQPNTHLQGTRAGEYLAAHGSKKVFSLAAQTPFAVDGYKVLTEALKAHGADTVGQVIYDQAKTTFRTEIDEMLKAKPDSLYLNSYQPDLAVLLRELFRAGYEGKKFTYGYAANAKLLGSVPANVSDGLVAFAPSPDVGSPAYAKVKAILGGAEPDPYSCQVHDHVSLAVLAIAKAGAVSGQAIHDNVRGVGDPAGTKVTSAVEGLKLLAAGKAINYEGASGPCKFTPTGDISNCKFRFDVAEKGKMKLLEIS